MAACIAEGWRRPLLLMDWYYMLAVGAVLLLAGAAQSAVGFGYALFATPPLVMLGLPLPAVVTLVASCSMFQSAMGVRKLNADVPWRLSFVAAGVRLAGVLVGVVFLKRMADLDPARIRLLVGVILCVLVAVQYLWKTPVVEHMHWGWGGLAFSTSGVLAGLCGMGGPPLVLWSMAHNWSSQKTRGFLFAVFMISIPVQILVLYFTFGNMVLRDVGLAIVCIPLVYAGTRLGMPVGDRMLKQRLRSVAYLILLFIGISAILPPLLSVMK